MKEPLADATLLAEQLQPLDIAEPGVVNQIPREISLASFLLKQEDQADSKVIGSKQRKA